ncbi:FHA domain-containing protein [Luteitalea sp.]|uniref:FHA domain-containing protein n=1 Tax=Luteitalea sp. TaxID=2004800 RepID=UPI0025BDB80D|nr:FHA domain-containing protein [Luteitalea sp.]
MSWARATLRRGTSAGSVWQVDQNYPQARVVVGSSPAAGWVVTGPGITMFHIELYWDGNALYVADPQAAGDVRLNGQSVSTWVQVQGRGQLTFGQAILDLETAVAEATAMVRDPGAAPRISLVGEATRVGDELENERTRVAESMSEIPPSKAMVSARPAPPPGRAPAASMPPAPPRPPMAPLQPGPPPTPPGPAPTPPGPPSPGLAGGPERPRLGGAPAGFRPEAKTLMSAELAPLGQEATRMVDSDALLGGGSPAPAVGFGGAPQGFGGAPQQGFGGAPQGFGGAPQAPQGFGGAPQGFGGPPQPPPSFGGPPTAPSIQNPPVAPGAGAGAQAPGGPTPPATGGFAAPPSYAATQQLSAQQGNKLPTRTWLMVALFVAVVLAWLSMPTPEEEAAAVRATVSPTMGTVVPPGQDGGVDAGPRQYQNPSTFVPVLTVELLDGGLSRTPDSVAAQLVTEGHLEDALAQYEALRATHPERPEYAVMCEVLRRQLMARCTNGQRWDGTPCWNP